MQNTIVVRKNTDWTYMRSSNETCVSAKFQISELPAVRRTQPITKRPTFLQPMSNCYNGYMVNNNKNNLTQSRVTVPWEEGRATYPWWRGVGARRSCWAPRVWPALRWSCCTPEYLCINWSFKAEKMFLWTTLSVLMSACYQCCWRRRVKAQNDEVLRRFTPF